MVTHLVVMNLHEPKTKDFVALQVLSLAGRIPGLVSVRGGTSIVELATTWDLGFIMQFTDKESVLSYQSHPAHVDVADQIRDLIREMATCDLPNGQS